MNYLTLLNSFLLFVLIFATGCEDLSKTNLSNTTVSATEGAENSIRPTLESSINNEDIKPNLLFGSIDIGKDNKSMQISVWAQEARLYNDEKDGKITIAKRMEVDVMNCGGYLGSATATYENQMWELAFIPGTIAVDFNEKVKQCGQAFGGGRISTSAVAVYPKDEKRRNIKISQLPDVQEIIKKFPKDVRLLAGLDSKNSLKNKELMKNLGNGSTDLDGDGVIDFLLVGTDCLPNVDSGCEIAMRLINGEWKQVARIEPF